MRKQPGVLNMATKQNFARFNEADPKMKEKFAWLRAMATQDPQKFDEARLFAETKIAELQERVLKDLREALGYQEIVAISDIILSERKV